MKTLAKRIETTPPPVLPPMTLDRKPLRGMNRTDIALYWATASWIIPDDVSRETGLPVEHCPPITSEVKRVRKLYAESSQPLFRSLNGLLRPLSRELDWVERYIPEGGEAGYEEFVAWARRAKVGEKREVTVQLGNDAEIRTTFVCERVE